MISLRIPQGWAGSPVRALVAGILVVLAASCNDEGPGLPLLFVDVPEGSNGAGIVVSSPAGISCSISNQSSLGTCSHNFEEGTIVGLTATAATGSLFAEWGGACSGNIPTCSVTLDASSDVTARFALVTPRSLAVSGTGSGNGTIVSNPGGIACAVNGGVSSGTCAADFADGSAVILIAAGTIGSGFISWDGDCLTAGAAASCDLTMSQARSASAEFVSTSFAGLVASVGSTDQGLLVVSIPTASAGQGSAARLPGLSLRAADVVAIGTLQVLGGGSSSVVAGTFDPDQKILSLTGGATSFEMTAQLSGGVFQGLFSDENLGGGPAALLAATATSAPVPFCGTFAGDSTGTWNLVRADTLLSGLINSPNSLGRTLAGTVKSRVVSLILAEPFGGGQTGTATGNLSADGLTMNGTWEEGGGQAAGTWQVSTTCN